jgi:hypothetical protein
MATTVGSIGCDLISGMATTLTTTIETWAVPGLNGVGAIDMGANSSGFAFNCVEVDTSSNIETWFSNLEATKGTIITITDSFGTAYTNCLVTQVVRESKKAVIHEGGLKSIARATVSGVVTE